MSNSNKFLTYSFLSITAVAAVFMLLVSFSNLFDKLERFIK